VRAVYAVRAVRYFVTSLYCAW